jgi:hypothetical protein
MEMEPGQVRRPNVAGHHRPGRVERAEQVAFDLPDVPLAAPLLPQVGGEVGDVPGERDVRGRAVRVRAAGAFQFVLSQEVRRHDF